MTASVSAQPTETEDTADSAEDASAQTESEQRSLCFDTISFVFSSDDSAEVYRGA